MLLYAIKFEDIFLVMIQFFLSPGHCFKFTMSLCEVTLLLVFLLVLRTLMVAGGRGKVVFLLIWSILMFGDRVGLFLCLIFSIL